MAGYVHHHKHFHLHGRHTDQPASREVSFPSYVPADAIAVEMANAARAGAFLESQRQIEEEFRKIFEGGNIRTNVVMQRMRRLRRQFSKRWDEEAFLKLARPFHVDFFDFQKGQIKEKIRAELNVEPVFRDRQAERLIDQDARRSAQRLSGAMTAQFNDVANDAVAAIRELRGDAATAPRSDGFLDKAKEAVGAAVDAAMETARKAIEFVAWDGAGSSMSKASKMRNEEVGVTHYFWVSVGDNRVRPTHAAANGQRYPWKTRPAVTGAYPGEDYRCRCGSEADLKTTTPAAFTTRTLAPAEKVEPTSVAPEVGTNRGPIPTEPPDDEGDGDGES